MSVPSSAIGDFVIGESPIGGAAPPVPPPFPPSGPTGISQIIAAYLYKEYDDDEDLQALVDSYNEIAQQYLDWFNNINLPIYTGPNVSDLLLDWVGTNLYGTARPVLPSGQNQNIGLINTYMLNELEPNQTVVIGPQNYYSTTDDVYRRVITWAFFKGDGKYFTLQWLKRRVMRFLFGENGINFNVDQTYQVSVSFGLDRQVNIRILAGIRTIVGGAFPNACMMNDVMPNQVISTFQDLPAVPLAPIFQAAVEAGVLELPFQYDWVVTV